MGRLAPRTLAAGLILWAAAGPALAELTTADLTHIRAMETGLLPAVIVKGEATPTKTLAGEMRDLHVPGVSIAFFENGRVVWAKGYGLADVEHNVPVTPATLFQAGSISKPLAAMAALRLVQDGRLKLDEDVNLRLTGWKVPENSFTTTQKVTLRRLLSHTAGLTVHGFEGYDPAAVLPTLPQILNGAKPANSAPVVVKLTPGTKWDYSGGGYIVAQLLMQETSGLPFADLMRTTVLRPAGMTASTYEQPLPAARQASAALGYRGNGKPVAGGWHVYPEQAAAGLWTTPSDLASFAIELQNENAGTSSRILNPSMARTMLTPVLGEWGLGVNLPSQGPARFGHGGDNQGFKNDLVAFTGGKRQGFVIMSNGDNGGDLVAEVGRAIAASYGWTIDRPREVSVMRVDPAILAGYVGTYEIAGLARIAVTVKDGRLFIATPALGPDPLDARTSSPTRFFVAADRLFGEFQKAADGSVTGMALDTPIGAFIAKKIPDTR